jgi:transcriptional regulator with XRE-family HTH domain
MSVAGRMVREARGRSKLTQRELSAKVGIPQETIARIERDRVDPRITTLDRLLEGCGYGLASMPRPGSGVDREKIQERPIDSMEGRPEVAGADDLRHASGRRRSLRNAEAPPSTGLPTVLL